MNILERFIKYIKVPTASKSSSDSFPSTESQKNLAKTLKEELAVLGLDVYYDEKHAYIYAHLPGNIEAPKIGFVSHLDTSESAKGDNINPKIIENYDGEDILLNSQILTETTKYPDLKNHIGKTLITSDGTTLLGADDKAGIAEIMNMLEYFVTSNEAHGDIYVCFTPDEEIGKSMDYFDISKFPADFAYTVDGSSLGEICYENFNAATAKITIKGISTHCGTAKGVMVNASLIAILINNMLPLETPATTEKYEGFFHLDKITGTVSEATMTYLIRDFDQTNFAKRKQILEQIVALLNSQYNNCIDLKITDSYYNMHDVIANNLHLVDNAKLAMKSLNVIPIVKPIRGGTDGAELTRMGLPCPNLGTGGHNFHSIYEYITLEDMEKCSEILIAIVKEYAKEKNEYLKRKH